LKEQVKALKSQMAMFVCPSPPIIAAEPNLLIDISASAILNTVATYSCKDGYFIDGATSVTCKQINNVAAWSPFDPKPPTCVEKPKCADNHLALGSTCVFVGSGTTSSTTLEQAKQMCTSSAHPNSHLAYIKRRDEYDTLLAYLRDYNSKQNWRHSSMALGGSYNPTSAQVEWYDGSTTSSVDDWGRQCCFPRNGADKNRMLLFVNTLTDSGIDNYHSLLQWSRRSCIMPVLGVGFTGRPRLVLLVYSPWVR